MQRTYEPTVRQSHTAPISQSHDPSQPIFLGEKPDDPGIINDAIKFSMTPFPDWSLVKPGTATATYREGCFFRPLVGNEEPKWFMIYIQTLKILDEKGKSDVEKKTTP